MLKHKRPLLGAATAAIALGAAIATTAATGASTQKRHASATATCAAFTINGRVAHRTKLRVDDLRALPAQTADVTFQSGSGSQTHHYAGALLTDVAALAAPTFDPAVKNDSLRFYVKAVGSDGYAAIVSWGEVDPGFGGNNVLAAYEEDGHDLCADGPRLVVPGDVKGGRYVSNVVRLQIGRAGGSN